MARAGGLWIFIGLTVALTAPAAALEVTVWAPGEGLDTDSTRVAPSLLADGSVPERIEPLLARFRVSGIFDDNDKLGDGIPATLILVVDLWRVRSGWWDSLVQSQAFSYRFRRDVWDGTYQVWFLEPEPDLLTDRDALVRRLEREHEVSLGSPERFEPGTRYYLSVRAVLRPLELEDLEEIDAWLSGDVTGGGGVLGLPRTLARLVIDVSGLGDESAVGRSGEFIPRPER